MDRSPPDSENRYYPRRQENNSVRFQRRHGEDDTYDQTSVPIRRDYDRNSQDNRYTFTRQQQQQQQDNEQPPGGQRVLDNRQNDRQERGDGSYRAQPRLVTDSTHETIQRSQPQVNYTVNQNPSSNNPRSIVLDINISINIPGNRNSQITATANTGSSRSLPVRSVADIDGIGYVDLDLRSPERTARLATDGYIRVSPSKPSSTRPNDTDQ